MDGTPMRVRLLAATSVIVALAAGQLLIGSAASAAELPGIAIQDLPVYNGANWAYAAKDRGGWDDNYAGITTWTAGTPNGHKCTVNPGALFMGEPAYNKNQDGESIAIAGTLRHMTDSCDDPDPKEGDYTYGITNVVGDNRIQCANGSGGTIVEYDQHSGGPGVQGAGSVSVTNGARGSSVNGNDVGVATAMVLTSHASGGYFLGHYRAPCDRLVSIKLTVCVKTKATILGCKVMNWGAERFVAKTPYASATADPKTNWQHDLCMADKRGTECADHVKVDGTSFEDVCSTPPPTAWLNWDWLAPTIGYYGKCLFFPQNGFDPDSRIQTTFAKSSVGTMQDSLVRITSTFNYSSRCGIIADGRGTIVPVVINTCDWGSKYDGIRSLLAVGLWLGFGWWAVNFIRGTITGVITGENTTPIDDGKDGK
jgi:hypothetical protein